MSKYRIQVSKSYSIDHLWNYCPRRNRLDSNIENFCTVSRYPTRTSTEPVFEATIARRIIEAAHSINRAMYVCRADLTTGDMSGTDEVPNIFEQIL